MERFDSYDVALLNDIDFDKICQSPEANSSTTYETELNRELSLVSDTQMQVYDESPCPIIKKKTTITLYIEIDDNYQTIKASISREKCKGNKSNYPTYDSDMEIESFDPTLLKTIKALDTLTPKMELKICQALKKFVKSRPLEEAAYIKQVMPNLIYSLRKMIIEQREIHIDSQMIYNILKELIYSRELIISAEVNLIRDAVAREMEYLALTRPQETFDFNITINHKRKEKRSIKGNKNASALNHLNENYISNIFKFAKQAYPNDETLCQIASHKGVSATNFRANMVDKLTDDVFYRKAKVRIAESGKEFVQNVEYWIQEGYFENSNDKERYIQNKSNVLNNLALERLG